MKNRKKFLRGMLYQRMLILAEFEQNDIFRGIYTDILRKLDKK